MKARNLLVEIALEHEVLAFTGFDSGAGDEISCVRAHFGEGFGAD